MKLYNSKGKNIDCNSVEDFEKYLSPELKELCRGEIEKSLTFGDGSNKHNSTEYEEENPNHNKVEKLVENLGSEITELCRGEIEKSQRFENDFNNVREIRANNELEEINFEIAYLKKIGILRKNGKPKLRLVY